MQKFMKNLILLQISQILLKIKNKIVQEKINQKK